MNEREIFEQALDHVEPGERQAYLDSACEGDAALRARIEVLLISHSSDTQFLNIPALEQLHSPVPVPAKTIPINAHSGPDTVAEKTMPVDEVPLGFLSPATRPDSLGRIAHYETLQVLGNGGFGIVFRAFDDVLHRIVAVKVLSPHLAATSPARKRFLREARSSAQVRHENVVQVYAVGEQPLPYIAMEFIPGETLQQRLDRTGPLDVPEVLRIGDQIAEGLAAAHATELIHRDIKPGNVLLEEGTHKVKITDFGLARAADDASISQSGLVAGTPMYMAPEQALGETLDQRADLFSLGSVLYQMVSGRPPFRASSTLAVLKRVVEDTPRPIREIIPETPQWLCDIISKLHAKNPADRFQSAREVADLLGRCLAEMQRSGAVANLPEPQTATMEGVQPSLDLPAPTVVFRRPRVPARRWATAAASLLALVGVLGASEATGVTNLHGIVIRLLSPEGTLLVEVDDPGVSVQIDGSDVVITGAGAKEIRLKPGNYKVEGRKDGRIVSQELVTVTNNGKQVVRVSLEASTAEKVTGVVGKKPDPVTALSVKKPPVVAVPLEPMTNDTWIRALAALALDEQEAALVARLHARLPGFEEAFLKNMADMPASRQLFLLSVWLRERNPGFDGKVTHKTENGMVTGLELPSPLVQDLTPLRGLTKLRTLTCRRTVGYDKNADNDNAVLGSLEALEKINDKPVAEFRQEVTVRQAAFKEFLKAVPAMMAQAQVSAVAAMLKERNPDFNGQVSSKIEDGVVTEIGIGGPLTDLTPLRPLLGLKVLKCSSGTLWDLSPLKGMSLTSINLAGSKLIQNLEPLRGMPLTSLDVGGWVGSSAGVSDLEPLKGMPLTSLNVRSCPVRNLEPLRGMPLAWLEIGLTPVQDLTPLQGMPLTSLYLHNCTKLSDLTPLKGLKLTLLDLGGWMRTPIRDLGVLKGMPLKSLSITATGVTDLEPLKGMQLEDIHLTPQNITHGFHILRDMKSLKTIGEEHNRDRSAEDFWARYDNGDFR